MEIGSKAVRSRVGLPVLGNRAEAKPVTYYDIPFLKRPTWHWPIASYFFLEGVSSGAFLLAALAELSGAGRFRAVTRAGHYISFAAFLPCPPLLIYDLGRPERFHHMLRIFKPTSPMSHGSWALAAYGLPMGLLTTEQLLDDVPGLPDDVRKLGHLVPIELLSALGIPCALMLATYPGVLLATTSNPLWSRSRLLGALFACSSIHSGASALTVALALRRDVNEEAARIARIEQLATIAEAGVLAAFLATTGRQSRHLTTGRYRSLFVVGAVGVGMVLPVLLKALGPKTGKRAVVARIAGSLLSLAGGFALKWAITHAGALAADDARTSHDAALPSREAPGWGTGKEVL